MEELLLIQAKKLQKRASRVSFDCFDAKGSLNKTHEACSELQRELELADNDKLKDELSDLLFSVVNVAPRFEPDAEQAIRQANEKLSGVSARLKNCWPTIERLICTN